VVGGVSARRWKQLARELTPDRSDIYGATLPVADGEARKLVVVVSRDSINQVGMNVIVARLTKQERFRALPSTVVIEPEADTGLAVRSFVLCHDLLTIPQGLLDIHPKGRVPFGKMLEVEAKLRYALDLG
jgi:mRNA-degrading endonuclease toxin of MazEF toxin-antitoxin module